MAPNITELCSHGHLDVTKQQWICKSNNNQLDNPITDQITAVLEGAELWMQLKSKTNEMVVGPQGRRMFPNFNVRLAGLHPTRYYHVFIEALPTDTKHFTFNHTTKCWQTCGKAESESNKRIYYHPDTPLQGSGWMRKPVSFKTPKFTTGQREGNMIEVREGQKYMIVLHIVEISDDMRAPNRCSRFLFDETEFMTVTSHQSEEVAAAKLNRAGRINNTPPTYKSSVHDNSSSFNNDSYNTSYNASYNTPYNTPHCQDNTPYNTSHCQDNTPYNTSRCQDNTPYNTNCTNNMYVQ